MAATGWVDGLSKTISKFTPKQDIARFRNDYSDIVQSINPREKKCPIRDALNESRAIVEGWITEGDKCPCCAAREWNRLYDITTQNRIPLQFLLACAKKLPGNNSQHYADWKPFFLRCKHTQVLLLLVDRKVVTARDVESWLVEDLDAVYPTAALDVALNINAVPDIPRLWSVSLRLGSRRVGLTSQEVILAQCYMAEVSSENNEAMIKFLLDNPSARRQVFAALFDSPADVIRLTNCLAQHLSTPKSIRKKRGTRESVADVFRDLLDYCHSWLDGAGNNLTRAALSIAGTRMSLAAHRLDADIASAVADASVEFADLVLQHTEEDVTSNYGSCYLVLRGVELHTIAHRYLRSLASGASEEQSLNSRSTQYERHLGQKEVLEQIVNALDQTDDDKHLRGQLEVALFNAGVRPLGQVGKSEPYDFRLHKAETNQFQKGDAVKIVKAGRGIGEGAEIFVLSKALVEPDS